MSVKVVVLPKETIPVVMEPATENRAALIAERNAFVQLVSRIAELKKAKNNTDVVIAHALDEKVKAASLSAKTIELEESELLFLKQGIEQLQAEGQMQGSIWYQLIGPLESAVDKKVFDRKASKGA